MKPLLLILLFSSTVAAAGQFESLGQPCRAFNVLASRVITDPQGKEWFVLSNTNETTGVELIFIDFKNNTAKKYPAPAGQGAWLLNPVKGDRLIVGTYYDGKMMVFDLKSMSFTKVIPMPGEEYFWNGALGSDGRLYGGTYPGGKLGALNLDTLALEDLGQPAKPNLYCRNVNATPDGRLLCRFGMTSPIQKLYDAKTKQWSDVPPQLKGIERAVVWNDYLLAIGSRETVAFKGENFEPVNPPPFPLPPDDGNTWAVDYNLTTRDTLVLHRGNARWRLARGESKLTKIFDQNLKSGAITAAASDGSLLGVRGQDCLYVAPGQTTAELRPIPIEASPRPMHFVKADDQNRLWGGPIFGQTLFWMDLASKKFTNTGIVCNAGGEVYDVAFHDNKVYAVSYAGGDIVEYDPAQPWDQLSGTNPRTIAHLTSKGYIRPIGGIQLGPDNKLYSTWMAKYGTYGGALAITDPTSRETKLIENPLGEQAACGFAIDKDFIYLGTSLNGNGLPNKPNDKPQFAILNREDQKILHQQPLGNSEITRIFRDPPRNQLLLIVDNTLKAFDLKARIIKDVATPTITAHAAEVHGDHFIFGSQDNLITLNLVTNESRSIKAPSKIDHLSLSPDGKTIYVTSGPNLYRVAP